MSLLEIDNLSELNEILPESLAREKNVLVVSVVNDVVTLACPDVAFDVEDCNNVEYILNCPLKWNPYKLDEIRTAINFAYGTARKVEGCSWEFKTQCPETWASLDPTDEPTVRNCNICSKLVHLCFHDSEVQEHAKTGNCICFVADKLVGESVGDVMLQEFDDAPIDFTDDADTPNGGDNDAE